MTERPGGAPFVNNLPQSVIDRYEKSQQHTAAAETDEPLMESDDAEPAATSKPTSKSHFVVVNPDYDDNNRLRSWDTERCDCDRPWRHPHGVR